MKDYYQNKEDKALQVFKLIAILGAIVFCLIIALIGWK
jgi:hypothetical protein